MQIIAHRGASADAPENSLAAVRLAWEQGADAVEVDVHLSRDGRVMVVHDASVARYTGVRRLVSDMTWNELQALDAGSWKGPQWKGERFPALEEVLATVPSGRRMFVEIKSGPGSLGAIGEAVARSGISAGQLAFISFSHPVIKQAKQAFPGAECCWIVEHRPTCAGWKPSLAYLMERTLSARLDGLDFCARGPIRPTLVRPLHRAGLKVYVWTVDSLARAARMAEAGIDGVTTNRPGWLRDQLAART